MGMPPFPKGTLVADDKIVVEDGAKKHPVMTATGAVALPTEADVKREFKAAVRFTDLIEEGGGQWKWEVRDDKGRIRSSICFRVSGYNYRVFHYHKSSYAEG